MQTLSGQLSGQLNSPSLLQDGLFDRVSGSSESLGSCSAARPSAARGGCRLSVLKKPLTCAAAKKGDSGNMTPRKGILKNPTQQAQATRSSSSPSFGSGMASRNWDDVPSSILNGSIDFEDAIVDISSVSPGPSSDTRTMHFVIHWGTEGEAAEMLLEAFGQLEGVESVSIGHVREGLSGHGPEIPVEMVVRRSTPLSAVSRGMQELEDGLAMLALPFNTQSWNWRGHRVNYAVAGSGKPVVLVHGFGGNCGHFRNLISHLADDHRVYSVDLLGFGGSDKPAGEDYDPFLWADQVADFAREVVEEPSVLIGNSIGSLTALGAAAKLQESIRGVVLLNCTGAMNRKGLAEDDALIAALTPVFASVEFLLKQPRIAKFIFNGFRSKSYIKKILEQQVYVNKSAVTDRLVDILTTPALQDGALDVFVKVFTGNPGPRPEVLSKEVDCPMLVLWGEKDPWTPANGKVARYFKALEKERDNVQFVTLPNVAHCPHDDSPELVAANVLPWLRALEQR